MSAVRTPCGPPLILRVIVTCKPPRDPRAGRLQPFCNPDPCAWVGVAGARCGQTGLLWRPRGTPFEVRDSSGGRPSQGSRATELGVGHGEPHEGQPRGRSCRRPGTEPGALWPPAVTRAARPRPAPRPCRRGAPPSRPIRSTLGPAPPRAFSKSTDGLEFVPWVDMEVSALGYCDAGGDGLLNSHTVGIFDTDTKELVTPTVVVDSESVLDGSYRYEPITPVVLKEGRSYMVAGDSEPPFDPVAFDPVAGGGSRNWAPEMRFVGHSESYGDFEFPGYAEPVLVDGPQLQVHAGPGRLARAVGSRWPTGASALLSRRCRTAEVRGSTTCGPPALAGTSRPVGLPGGPRNGPLRPSCIPTPVGKAPSSRRCPIRRRARRSAE